MERKELRWITVLHDIPDENRMKLLEYCANAALQDRTFQYTVYPDRVIIYSPTKDKAYRRGSLLHHRYGCYYEVFFRQNP